MFSHFWKNISQKLGQVRNELLRFPIFSQNSNFNFLRDKIFPIFFLQYYPKEGNSCPNFFPELAKFP